MDQDIRFQMLPTVASSAATAYFAVPYRSVLRSVRAMPQAALASASSSAVTVTTGASVALGVAAFTVDSSGAAAAGVSSTYTPNTTTGSTVLAAGAVIKMAVSATQTCLLDIELDPYARSL